ncbi:MAG TPA: hypothetical protein VKU37_03895 [Verrucomicrobiae bacterium]|nr:hypothetical protein [Verrucomicrobiae bacterium]
MRWLLLSLLLLGSLSAAFAGEAAGGRVVKVLPLFLDVHGHEALSPSLYDRDAYQVYLRRHADQRSAIRFDVLWKAANTGEARLKLRVELRGLGPDGMPHQATLEQPVSPHFLRHWNSLTLGGGAYKDFGELVAWRVTLWSGEQCLGEQKSFLW